VVAFDQAVEVFTQLGVEYHCEEEWVSDTEDGKPPRHPVDLKYFRSVQLPLTPEEWCSIVMRDGEDNIGGCCGTTSVIQDIMEKCFYDGGWIGGHEFEEMAGLWIVHGDKEWEEEATQERLTDAGNRWNEIPP